MFGPFEDPPEVWGVGRLVVDGEVTPWPVSQADIDDEADSHAARLTALGLGEGDLVLVVAMLSEAIHAVPIEKAAGRCGALYSSADASPADAFRVAALVRQLEPRILVGVNDAVVEGLRTLGRDPVEVLSAVETVLVADDDAGAALPDARRWRKLGPTSAWEIEPGRLAYDADRWGVAVDDGGELLVTNRAERLTPSHRLRTGLRGRVDEPGTLALG